MLCATQSSAASGAINAVVSARVWQKRSASAVWDALDCLEREPSGMFCPADAHKTTERAPETSKELIRRQKFCLWPKNLRRAACKICQDQAAAVRGRA